MSNYPPGAENDPRAPYNQPDHSHKHEWRNIRHHGDVAPLFEDGTAIFHEECRYAEGRHGDGWQCEKERSYRFELEKVIHLNPDGQPERITVHKSEREHAEELWITAIETVESKAHPHGEDVEIVKLDPDREAGIVVIKYAGYRLAYEP